MYKICKHAMTRMSQRAVGSEDIELVFNYGTQIGPAEWFMMDSDVKREVENLKRTFRQIERTVKGGKQRLERALKRRIRQIERLSGKQLKVVMVDGLILTCYPSSRADQRRTFRRGREAGCFEKRNRT